MKKSFEFILILIIFYGVYSAFNQIAPMFIEHPNSFWVVIASLLVATGLLLLYAGIIAASAKQKFTEKVSELEQEIHKKDEEIKSAKTFKENLVREAEEAIDNNSLE